MAERNRDQQQDWNQQERFRSGNEYGQQGYGGQQQSGNQQGFQDRWMRGEENDPSYDQGLGQQQGQGRLVSQFGDGGARYVGGSQHTDDDQRFRQQERSGHMRTDSPKGQGQDWNQQGQGQQQHGDQHRQPFYPPQGSLNRQGQDPWGYGQQQMQTPYGHSGHLNYGYHGQQQSGQDQGHQGAYGGQYRQPPYQQQYGTHYGQGHQPGQQRQEDQSWWDKTKNEVSSWFGNDHPGQQQRQPSSGQNYPGGHRGRGPRDSQRSQDRIREDICDRLTDDDWLDASHVQVQVQGNEVILSGTVETREQKRRAEDLVEAISGVRHVENRLRVQPRSDFRGHSYERHMEEHQYTGVAGSPGSIGDESGTTNEIIRNSGTANNAGLDPNNTDSKRSRRQGSAGKKA